MLLAYGRFWLDIKTSIMPHWPPTALPSPEENKETLNSIKKAFPRRCRCVEMQKKCNFAASFLEGINKKLMISSMNGQEKYSYEAPSAMVFEVKTECVVCASPAQSSVQNYTWHDEVEE